MLIQALTESMRTGACPEPLVPSTKRLIQHLEFRQPDADFCLDYLGTLHCGGIQCEIFEKDYRYRTGMYSQNQEDE